MKKQELLTKLATECETWGEAIGSYSRAGAESGLMREDWLSERERLLNKPSWEDAPEGATHFATDSDGMHSFFAGEPTRKTEYAKLRGEWLPDMRHKGANVWCIQEAIAIPAGYDWKQSLEERPV